MQQERIEQLMAAMQRFSMRSLRLKEGDTELFLEREENTSEVEGKNRKDVFEDLGEEPEKKVADIEITSPMLGTFYSAPSATQEPFVTPGDWIEKGQIVCIIEAMKVMNEIHSEYSGRLVDVLPEDGDPLEYGSLLFRLESSAEKTNA